MRVCVYKFAIVYMGYDGVYLDKFRRQHGH